MLLKALIVLVALVAVSSAAFPAAPTLTPELTATQDKVIKEQFRDHGKWVAGTGFEDAALQALFAAYATADGLSPTDTDNCQPVAAAGRGGDLITNDFAGVPCAFRAWRYMVSSYPRWEESFRVRQQIAAAFFRWFLRQCTARNSQDYSAQVDMHLNHLWVSNVNGRSKEFGGPSNIYCAAAATTGWRKTLDACGYKAPGQGVYWNNKLQMQTMSDKVQSSTKALPGDILSIVGRGTPRTGHVVTVACSETNDLKSGRIWVVSGNAGPGGTVSVDSLKPAPYVSGFSPFCKTGCDDSYKTRIPEGHSIIYSRTKISEVTVAKLAGMDADALKKLKIERKDPAKRDCQMASPMSRHMNPEPETAETYRSGDPSPATPEGGSAPTQVEVAAERGAGPNSGVPAESNGPQSGPSPPPAPANGGGPSASTGGSPDSNSTGGSPASSSTGGTAPASAAGGRDSKRP